jgi:hypothetical protein
MSPSGAINSFNFLFFIYLFLLTFVKVLITNGASSNKGGTAGHTGDCGGVFLLEKKRERDRDRERDREKK